MYISDTASGRAEADWQMVVSIWNRQHQRCAPGTGALGRLQCFQAVLQACHVGLKPAANGCAGRLLLGAMRRLTARKMIRCGCFSSATTTGEQTAACNACKMIPLLLHASYLACQGLSRQQLLQQQASEHETCSEVPSLMTWALQVPTTLLEGGEMGVREVSPE